jgi:hypothetical protein
LAALECVCRGERKVFRDGGMVLVVA